MTQKGKFTNWLKTSITARMLVVGILIAVLMIPLAYVQDLIEERSLRQIEVVDEINDKWGGEVLLSGPILKIPYKTYEVEEVYDQKAKESKKITRTIWHAAYFLPDKLNYDSEVTTKPLVRSIYESVVYTTTINVKGNFDGIDFSMFDIPTQDIAWDKASLLVHTSNLKGIRNTLKIGFNDQLLEVTPKYNNKSINTIESSTIENLEALSNEVLNFNFDLKINGSESLSFIPLGKETSAKMNSNWHSPSFNGNYLPNDETKIITEDGFKADWSILQINRQFEQQFLDELPNLSYFKFGAKLVIPVDHYTQSERSSKYGFLVIGLTLLVFLLIQIVSKIYIHPFQYLLIGLALVLFYTLLVSISEHESFSNAYLIAGSATIGLVSLFAKAVLKSLKFGILILVSMTALYGFIYIIIQLESYALLVGSIGLFVILAVIMFVTRKIDWSNES